MITPLIFLITFQILSNGVRRLSSENIKPSDIGLMENGLPQQKKIPHQDKHVIRKSNYISNIAVNVF